MKIVFLTLIMAVVMILLEVPRLIKRGLKKELKVFFILLILAMILTIAKGFKLNIPNPSHWITIIYNPVIKLVGIMFK